MSEAGKLWREREKEREREGKVRQRERERQKRKRGKQPICTAPNEIQCLHKVTHTHTHTHSHAHATSWKFSGIQEIHPSLPKPTVSH